MKQKKLQMIQNIRNISTRIDKLSKLELQTIRGIDSHTFRPPHFIFYMTNWYEYSFPARLNTIFHEML